MITDPTFHRFEVLLLFFQIDDHWRRCPGERSLISISHLSRGIRLSGFLHHHQTEHFIAENECAARLRPVLNDLRALSELLRCFIQDVQLK